MLLTTLLTVLIILISTFPSGFLFAVALLRRTRLSILEVGVIGFIFGFMGPAVLTWLEAYLIPISSFFSFSVWLFELNAAILIIISFLVCYQQGAFKTFREDFLTPNNPHHVRKRHGTSNQSTPHWWVWVLLAVITLSAFVTRMQSIGTAPSFFEFDPYFDMIDTQYILTYGQQLLLDPSAWPAVPGGTNHRIEPLIPYVEAYWYGLANMLGPNFSTINTSMLADVAGVYPPITAALLVFVIFMLIYHEYNEYLGLIAAGLTATMPVIFSTFIAGEQLVEPWGIFALFFFFAAYMIAVKDMKNTRLAIFAGIAFDSNFIGAHYYTVTAGVLVIYILLQGVTDIIRGTSSRDFYKMNGIIIAIIAIFYVVYFPYSSTLQNRIPTVLGIPLTLSGPAIALIGVAIMDYGPKLLKKYNIFFKEVDRKVRLTWLAAMLVIAILVLAFTPLGTPIKGYLALSKKFTTPSSPLFMTVEEFIPTGITYNFGAQGFGLLGSNIFGLPLLIWFVCLTGTILLLISVIYRQSRMGILYLAIALPLMFAGFSEVKYLPHFGVAYILLFVIIIGELIYYAENNFTLKKFSKSEEDTTHGELIPPQGMQSGAYSYMVPILISVGLFFISSVIALLYLAYLALQNTYKEKTGYIWAFFGLLVAVIIISAFLSGRIVYGESSTYMDAITAGITAATNNATTTCNILSKSGDSIGYTLYCNNIQTYWLNAMSWVKQNVGPNGPRVYAWWDYGDWINWFGNSNAALRGDNANATEDYAFASQYTQGANANVTPQSFARFMNGNQSKYIIFPEDDIAKWGAINFLGCIYTKGTSYQYAVEQGQSQNPPAPYALGTSACEISDEPQYALIPLGLLTGNQSELPPSLNVYCTFSNSTAQYAQTDLLIGGSLSNQTVCVDINPNKRGVLSVYNQSGGRINAVIQSSYAVGVVNLQGPNGQQIPFVQFLMIYTPNTANGLITNAPSGFYNSNFYKGYFLGALPGFTQVYPANATGINMVNGTYAIRIFSLNNFTGTLPKTPPKPSYIHNNYTMP